MVTGIVTAVFVRQGDTLPCPTKGHPPFVHERSHPAIALHCAGTLVRVIQVEALVLAKKDVFRGSVKGQRWDLGPDQIKALKAWAALEAQRPVPPQAPEKALGAEPKPRRKATRAPKTGYFRRLAKTHPLASRQALEDCDYESKLSPSEIAFLNQFREETILNRWRDKEGVEALYPKGSPERRRLQFEYNRRVKDISAHRDWFPKEPSTRAYTDAGLFDGMVADNPTENELIAAIDRYRDE